MGKCQSKQTSNIVYNTNNNRRIIRPSPAPNSHRYHGQETLHFFVNKQKVSHFRSSYTFFSDSQEKYIKIKSSNVSIQDSNQSGRYYLMSKDPVYEGKYASIHHGFNSGNDINEPVMLKMSKQKTCKEYSLLKSQIKERKRIVPIIDTFHYKDQLVKVMPRYDNNLLQMGDSLFSNQLSLMKVIHQLAEGIASIHQEGHIFLDLKEINVMIDQAEDLSVKIGGFGNMADLRQLQKNSHLGIHQLPGSPIYMAPERYTKGQISELINHTQSSSKVASFSSLYKVDVWSFGIILFRLLTKYQSPLTQQSKYINQQSFFSRNYTLFEPCLIQLPISLQKYIKECLPVHWNFLLWITLAYQPSARIDSHNLFRTIRLFSQVFSSTCQESEVELRSLMLQAKKFQREETNRYTDLYGSIAAKRTKTNVREKYAGRVEEKLNELRKWIDEPHNDIHERLGWIVICIELEELVTSKFLQKMIEKDPNLTQEFIIIHKNITNQSVDFFKIVDILSKNKELQDKEYIKQRIQVLISWYICVSEGQSYKAKLERKKAQLQRQVEEYFKGHDVKWWVQWLKKHTSPSFGQFKKTNKYMETSYFEEIWQNLHFSQKE